MTESTSQSSAPVREHIMQFFAYGHLPPKLQAVSAPFGDLAERLHAEVPRNPERTEALRKLLEAKDAAVRALLAKDQSASERPPQPTPEHVWDAFANRWTLPVAKGPAISHSTVGA
ncbi:hypothetical protein [Myxococcus sp. AM009]|nr:hypothetical protein [Myxococcus sp. AM009]